MNQTFFSNTVSALAAVSLWFGSIAAAEAQVLRFVRTTDTIEVPLQTTLSSQATFEARIKIPTGGTPYGTIFHEQANAAEDKSLNVGTNFAVGAAFTLAGNYINRPTFAGTPNTIVDGLWHHIAFVRDVNEERFYLDGIRVYSIAWTPLIANSSASGPIAIGAGQFDYYQGAPLISVDWLRVSNVARYAGAFSPPPQCEPASDSNTLALFLFNEAAGSSTAVDSGPAGANGTVAIGFPSATAPVFENDPSQNGKPSFTQPVSQTVCPQDSATFSVTPTGTGPFTYQWQIQSSPPPNETWLTLTTDPAPLPCGATSYATATPANASITSIFVRNTCPNPAGFTDWPIRCIVSNACGSVTSNPATLTVREACCDSIDFNGDTLFPDDSDLIDFLSVLAGGACSTGTCNDIDFNNDGLFPDDNDLISFLRVLAGGSC